MDCTCSLSDLIKYLCGLASTPLGYIHNLKDNVDSLQKETRDLNARSEYVKATAQRKEEGGGEQITSVARNWLDNVQKFLGEADKVLREAREHDRIKCLSHCLPQNCWSGYQLGKTVHRMLNGARELKKEEFEITSPLLPPRVLAMPMEETVGLDISFNKVWKWLVDEKEIRMIGLYGKGGVGKTTLMKKIYNNLSHTNHGFEVIIWGDVSRQVNEEKIQETIRRGLHIDEGIWQQWSKNGDSLIRLFNVLKDKKFVLLFDDVWARLDLSKIGVPDLSKIGVSCSCLKNGSKVVFTTRSEEVCHQMGADEAYEVQCLTPEDAIGLFKNNVSKLTIHSNPEIPELAKHIALECKGLPLALVIVGRAMAGKDNPIEWIDALKMLRSEPQELLGMVEEVYHKIKFSYDNLNDTTRQACFLYCCCFPEDYLIMTDKLIELWIGEGLLGDINDVHHIRGKGVSILEDLKRACLLESGPPLNGSSPHLFGQSTVKMHDVIRGMAIWIACGCERKENKLLVIENEEDMSAEMISKWGEAEKVSLWGSLIANINRTPPTCSQLETLFVRETKVMLVPRGFFKSMIACLKVLDLSDNENIESFPEEICDLSGLRYLNLSGTRISELPKAIKKLAQLRWLLFDGIELVSLVLIVAEAIASLRLNVFSTWGSSLEKEEKVVEELRKMQNLTDLSIDVQKSFSIVKIFQFLQRCVRRVRIYDCRDLTDIPISQYLKGSANFSHLEVLYLQKCPILVEMEITQGKERAPDYYCFPSLVKVLVYNCGFLDLSWLVHAPKLQLLIVRSCRSVEKIIGDGFARGELPASGLFSCLKCLDIYNLPNLRNICDPTLFFPQEVEFRIGRCPNLRNLPLDSSSARGSFSITGERDWWGKLAWDPTARVTLEMSGESPAEEMTFGEALGKMKDNPFGLAKIGVLSSGAE